MPESYTIQQALNDFREENNRRFDKVDAAQAHTNGDVTDLKMWRGYLTGGVTVIAIIVIPLLVYVWQQSQSQSSQLQSLSNYQQKYQYETTINNKNH